MGCIDWRAVAVMQTDGRPLVRRKQDFLDTFAHGVSLGQETVADPGLKTAKDYRSWTQAQILRRREALIDRRQAHPPATTERSIRAK